MRICGQILLFQGGETKQKKSVHEKFVYYQYFLNFCSLAQEIPGCIIEKLKVLVRKQQEVSLWKSLRVLCCMAFAWAYLVLTYLVCA